MRIKNANVAAGLISVHPCMTVVMLSVERHLGEYTTITDTDRRVNGKSLHRYGLALDFRTKDRFLNEGSEDERYRVLKMQVKKIAADLPGFDVVLENFGEANEHLHIEFDPRVG